MSRYLLQELIARISDDFMPAVVLSTLSEISANTAAIMGGMGGGDLSSTTVSEVLVELTDLHTTASAIAARGGETVSRLDLLYDTLGERTADSLYELALLQRDSLVEVEGDVDAIRNFSSRINTGVSDLQAGMAQALSKQTTIVNSLEHTQATMAYADEATADVVLATCPSGFHFRVWSVEFRAVGSTAPFQVRLQDGASQILMHLEDNTKVPFNGNMTFPSFRFLRADTDLNLTFVTGTGTCRANVLYTVRPNT